VCYQDRQDVLVTKESFWLLLGRLGRIQSVLFRLDDGVPHRREMRAAYARQGVVRLAQSDLAPLLAATRLRIQAMNPAGTTIAEEEIDLTGLAAAHRAMLQIPECQ
jgi:hypothetical protein